MKAGRGAAGRPLEPGDVLAHQLSHFVNTLHQFVMDRLLHGAWLELQQVSDTPAQHSFFHSFIHSFIHSFVRSFVRLFIHSFILGPLGQP